MISQDQLINSVCKKTNIDYPTTRLLFQAIEDASIEYLLETTEENPITIKLFSGLTVGGKYMPERIFRSFDEFYCEPKIKVKAKVTRHFNEKINRLQ